MDVAVKVMGAIDIIAALVIILGNYWIGVSIIGWILLLKGIMSILS
jgi:hypothetical protein